jgi:hypothetical protein
MVKSNDYSNRQVTQMPIDKEMQDELTKQMSEAEDGKGAEDLENNLNAEDRGDEHKDDTGSPGEVDGEKKEPETDQGADTGGVGIPHVRFNVVNERRKEAEQRVADLEAKLAAYEQMQYQPAAPTADPTPAQPDANEALLKYNLEAATRAYTEAISSGDADAAVKAQLEVQEMQTKMMLSKMPQAEEAPSMQEAIEEVNFSNTVDVLKSQYPQLDEESKHFDETAVLEVNKLFTALSGVESKSQAIKSAVQYVFPGTQTRKPGRADTEKNIQDAQDAAPDLTHRGEEQGGDPYKGVKVANLSDEDFEKLPETKKAEIRGDFL